MADRTCIICGGKAGSAEHVFPAALGGRRKHKGIYCHVHNNAYSGLVALLSEQLTPINALIGVRPDRQTEPKSVLVRDSDTGLDYYVSIKGSRYAGPRVLSDEIVDGNRTVQMQFSTRAEMNAWVDEQKANGFEVAASKPVRGLQFVGATKIPMSFGGEEGLRALGYLGQTFLAQAFPALARSAALLSFKNYTRALEQAHPVWWDFDRTEDLPQSGFAFGHQFSVGVDGSDGLIFGRISLFSSLHFAIEFGRSFADEDSKTVTIDIDPLAEHPPHDAKTYQEPSARLRPIRPMHPTEKLGEAIHSGRMKEAFSALLRRITDANLDRTAEAVMAKIAGVAVLSAESRKELFREVLVGESQRILNLMRYVVGDIRKSMPRLAPLLPLFEMLVAADPKSPNGISSEATQALHAATDALVDQFVADFGSGTLSEQRISELLGHGIGASIVGRAILLPVIEKL